ncbi:UNVERIFIED_CONTAM: hypothetical protein Sangu_0604200 [Sesamum angustifolium]|uniref:Uncharacterized protein n=1 Tax=Sesamum angustifolium TaxID=2727405 RepID=A0AAW2QBT5_9LAMI
MSQASKAPPVPKDEGKSDAAASTTSAGTPSEQGRATPPVAAMPNPLDLSAMIGLINVCNLSSFSSAFLRQPGIKELAELMARDPSFNKMAEQLQEAMQGVSVEEGMPNFDTFSTMQQVIQSSQFMDMAERLGNTLMELEEQGAYDEDPSLKPILEEFDNDGPAAMMRYCYDEAFRQNMGKAMGFDVGADGAASAGEDKTEEANGEESIVHHTASVGYV